MKKVFFFGTGYCAGLFGKKVKKALKALGDFQFLGFIDNDPEKREKLFEGCPVYAPEILEECHCDMVLVFLMDDKKYKDVYRQLSQLIPQDRIHEYFFPLRVLLQERYKDSEDKEIKETLKYISDNRITVFNQHIKAACTYDEVKWDDGINLPYIDFTTIEGKIVPMYYPRTHQFVEKDGKKYVENLLWEQSAGSPHLYTNEKHDVSEGDCIVDAGVCEGNFALKYVDVASYIYLFESDPVWQEPLRHTFKAFEKKVKIIDKAVSNIESNHTCRIDDVVAGTKVDFIKMDIEGAEISAMEGAKKVFGVNHAKASICCYHRRGDEEKIRLFLEKYGYQTSTSEGYMLYLYADDTWELGDLRRGVIYGD